MRSLIGAGIILGASGFAWMVIGRLLIAIAVLLSAIAGMVWLTRTRRRRV